MLRRPVERQPAAEALAAPQGDLKVTSKGEEPRVRTECLPVGDLTVRIVNRRHIIAAPDSKGVEADD